MWCWPWHAPNRNLVAGLMESLFRLFAVSCTYRNAAISALTPVNNARLFGAAPDGPSFQRISAALIAMAHARNLFLGPDQRDGQPDFSASPGEKHWNQWQRQDSYSVGGNVARRDSPDAREFAGRMLSIHSENCRNSISRREKSYPCPGGNLPGQIRPEVPRHPAFIVTKHSCA